MEEFVAAVGFVPRVIHNFRLLHKTVFHIPKNWRN